MQVNSFYISYWADPFLVRSPPRNESDTSDYLRPRTTINGSKCQANTYQVPLGTSGYLLPCWSPGRKFWLPSSSRACCFLKNKEVSWNLAQLTPVKQTQTPCSGVFRSTGEKVQNEQWQRNRQWLQLLFLHDSCNLRGLTQYPRLCKLQS